MHGPKCKEEGLGVYHNTGGLQGSKVTQILREPSTNQPFPMQKQLTGLMRQKREGCEHRCKTYLGALG